MTLQCGSRLSDCSLFPEFAFTAVIRDPELLLRYFLQDQKSHNQGKSLQAVPGTITRLHDLGSLVNYQGGAPASPHSSVQSCPKEKHTEVLAHVARGRTGHGARS